MRTKILFAILFTLTSNFIKAQSQLGIKSGYKINNLKSDDLVIDNFNQYSLGLSYLQFISRKIDLLLQADYSFNNARIESKKDFYGNIESSQLDIVSINSFNFEVLSNYYFIEPNTSQFNFGIQGGIGTTLLNEWANDYGNIDFEGIDNFKQYFIFGVTGGFEKLRVDLRYGHFFQNFLSSQSLKSIPDEYYRTDSRPINGTNKYFSITLTYYLTNLLHD